MAKVAQHEAMDAETVAGLLDVSTRQINNYINLKGLPSHGEGRRRTFVWAEVREWYVDYRITLEAGDVIATGTPPGVGMARKPPRWLRAGDNVTVAIDGLGELRNPVVAEP